MFPDTVLERAQNDLKRPLHGWTHVFLLEASYQQRVNLIACRGYVLKKEIGTNIAEHHKNNEKGILLCKKGNELYLAREFPLALEKYNESICWSETGSEHLAMSYANRSAVHFHMESYDAALSDIKLAKYHNYPEQLKPKLLAREVKCKEKIRDLNPIVEPRRRVPGNLPGNPRIPFLADGIQMQLLPGYGRGMVAGRNFKTGDVILQEKPLFYVVNDENKYLRCDYCSSDNFYSLVPCPNCPSVMYCNQECLEKAWRIAHRFECGISTKLHHFSLAHARLAPRMFFYALTLFEDNVERMMEFCQTNTRVGSDPLSFDYTSYDPIEEFKLLQTMYIPVDKRSRLDTCIQMFHTNVFHSIYMQHPLVKSIFTTEEQKRFMILCMQDYFKAVDHLLMTTDSIINYIYTVASVCNHSCDPNTFLISCFGQLKFIVNRPITKGEQITVSYGPRYVLISPVQNQHLKSILSFECICDVCDLRKLADRLLIENPVVPGRYIKTILRIAEEPYINIRDKIKSLEKFIDKFSKMNMQGRYYKVLNTYEGLLIPTVFEEIHETRRAKLRSQE